MIISKNINTYLQATLTQKCNGKLVLIVTTIFLIISVSCQSDNNGDEKNILEKDTNSINQNDDTNIKNEVFLKTILKQVVI